MRRLSLGLTALLVLVSSAFFGFPVRADGVLFDMVARDTSIGTLIVCRDGRSITGTIESEGRVICGPATFERTGRRQGRLVCEDGRVLLVSENPATPGLAFEFDGIVGGLRRLR